MAMCSRDSATTRRRQSESFRSSSWSGAARCVEELAVGGPERNLTSRLPSQGTIPPDRPLQHRGSTSPSPPQVIGSIYLLQEVQGGSTLQTPPAFPGAGDRTRTDDLLITSELLYH